MLRIELDREDAELLADLLDNWLGDTRMEIADTDRQDYRTGLHAKKHVVEQVLHQLKHALDTGPEVRVEERA